MNSVVDMGRPAVVALIVAGLASAQNVGGVATFGSIEIPFELDGAGSSGQPNGSGMVKWPNPDPPPDTLELTVRWDRVIIGDVEWLVISRDGIILGAVREPGGTASNAWLNDGSNGGTGQFGTWS